MGGGGLQYGCRLLRFVRDGKCVLGWGVGWGGGGVGGGDGWGQGAHRPHPSPTQSFTCSLGLQCMPSCPRPAPAHRPTPTQKKCPARSSSALAGVRSPQPAPQCPANWCPCSFSIQRRTSACACALFSHLLIMPSSSINGADRKSCTRSPHRDTASACRSTDVAACRVSHSAEPCGISLHCGT